MNENVQIERVLLFDKQKVLSIDKQKVLSIEYLGFHLCLLSCMIA